MNIIVLRKALSRKELGKLYLALHCSPFQAVTGNIYRL